MFVDDTGLSFSVHDQSQLPEVDNEISHISKNPREYLKHASIKGDVFFLDDMTSKPEAPTQQTIMP